MRMMPRAKPRGDPRQIAALAPPMPHTPANRSNQKYGGNMKFRLAIVFAALLLSSTRAYSQSVGSDVDKTADKTADAPKNAAKKPPPVHQEGSHKNRARHGKGGRQNRGHGQRRGNRYRPRGEEDGA